MATRPVVRLWAMQQEDPHTIWDGGQVTAPAAPEDLVALKRLAWSASAPGASSHMSDQFSAKEQFSEEKFLEEEAAFFRLGRTEEQSTDSDFSLEDEASIGSASLDDDGDFDNVIQGWQSDQGPNVVQSDPDSFGWMRTSMRRTTMTSTSPINDSRALNIPIPLHPIPPPMDKATTPQGASGTRSASTVQQKVPLRTRSASTVEQKVPLAAVFRKHGTLIFFFASLAGLTVLVWFGIKSIYTDPAILVGRFAAATTIVCFSVFLFPFVRAFQGQIYDKLTEFASFFNPHMHKTLGYLFIAAGTFHGILWNIATWRSCEGTWCPEERYAETLVDQIACIQTFCHKESVKFDAYARGGLPSFSNAFATLPSNLHKSQAPIRSFYLGFICWSLFAVISIFTLPRIRRQRFELFYYSHHLFIVAVPMFFAHCWTLATPSFHVQLMIIPCSIATIAYVFDKMYSILFRRYTSSTVDTIFYSGNRILELRFRPESKWPLLNRVSMLFSKESQSETLVSPMQKFFAPGAYMDINCPAVSKFQWHPFTISSSPDADFVSVTMQVLPGGWTEQVAKACTMLQDQTAGVGQLSVIDGEFRLDLGNRLALQSSSSNSRFGIDVPLHFNISGPFGAPSIAYQHYDCLIGIGGGIGFTPFMSILKDFMAEKRRSRLAGDFESSGQRALFFGVCRNISDVAWWSSLASEPDFSDFVSSCSSAIEVTGAGAMRQSMRQSGNGMWSIDAKPQIRGIDAMRHRSPSNIDGVRPASGQMKKATIVSDIQKGFLAITLFCTGANQEQLSAAKALAAPGVSVRPGRPRFDNIFKNVDRKLKRKGRIGVFVCGGDALCNSVERASAVASATSQHEFVFHKEIFG